MAVESTEKDWKPRVPRPCPDCGRMGSCADCCCAAPDHRRPWPLRPDGCSLCGHVTSELSAEVVAAQAGVNRALWRARHVDSGATVYCRNRQEAEAHVHESASGPWVAEQVTSPGGPDA